ncbi:ankyrin repeat domain-containing protein [Pseudonocardia endophytica]|uniref:Ankyrin repeat protein n=1 Tax=Pseudonocardia endophytica TaxID=401976 RepID=A0A4V2PIN1_PSEEN|nr:ankyrin repeat domain-containing protein [Pseudonocardia endophytica]TCK25296.1 ankyrin repeat protein [Pseudonocardia endophytica]
MVTINEDDELSQAAVWAIQEGMCDELRLLLDEEPWLALAWLRDADPLSNVSWSLLHVVTGWPGHFQDGPVSVGLLVEAGANVNARFRGEHEETPLHWAASSDDVDVLDALLDAGADIEARGAVIGGGTPLADARSYKQWRAAFRLVERGATTTLVDAATLGLLDRVERAFANGEPPGQDDVDAAFWGACHGGRTETADFLLGRGADLD